MSIQNLGFAGRPSRCRKTSQRQAHSIHNKSENPRARKGMAICSVQMSSLWDMMNDWDGGSIEGICSFIEKHPESMSRTDFIGRTPLHVAIQSHMPLPLIKFLVDKRPEALGQAGRKGEFPIHMAARAGCPVATIKLLLKHRPGSLKERTVGTGYLPLHCAAEGRAPLPLLKFLVDQCPESIRAGA
jgi:ankyrin repeat protein